MKLHSIILNFYFVNCAPFFLLRLQISFWYSRFQLFIIMMATAHQPHFLPVYPGSFGNEHALRMPGSGSRLPQGCSLHLLGASSHLPGLPTSCLFLNCIWGSHSSFLLFYVQSMAMFKLLENSLNSRPARSSVCKVLLHWNVKKLKVLAGYLLVAGFLGFLKLNK